MKTAPSQLVTFFNTATQCITFDLWTITLQSGAVLRWTDADIDITSGGNTFVRGPVITRSRCSWKRGIEVDSLSVTLDGPSQLIGAQALPAFAAAGGFDAAKVQLDRVHFDTSLVLQGSLLYFVGTVSDVSPSRMGAKLTVKSALAQLSQQLPRNVYQATCMNNLFDSNCAVNRAANTIAGTVSAVGAGNNPPITVTFASALAAAQVQLGIAGMTSGANAGIARTVQLQTGTGTSVTLQFARPFPFALQVGDTLSATAGCDKLVTTCVNKFSNLTRFRGQPFIPIPETAL